MNKSRPHESKLAIGDWVEANHKTLRGQHDLDTEQAELTIPYEVWAIQQ